MPHVARTHEVLGHIPKVLQCYCESQSLCSTPTFTEVGFREVTQVKTISQVLLSKPTDGFIDLEVRSTALQLPLLS